MSPVAARPLWTRFLPWAVVLGATFTAANISGWLGLPGLHALSKPFTTCLVLLYAWQAPGDGTPRKRWVLAGLMLAVAGDAALAWPQAFLVGLACFLGAQLCYLAAFRVGVPARGWPLVPTLLHAAVIAWMMVLWSRADAVVVAPAWIYLVALGGMSLAAERWWWHARATPQAGRALIATLGGLMFVVADLIWAVSQFVTWLPGTILWVMACYWMAQWSIAASLRPCPGAAALSQALTRQPPVATERDTSAMPL